MRPARWPGIVRVILVPFIGLAAGSAGAADVATAFAGARVFDGSGRAPYRATVVIRGERIEAAGPRVEPPPGARVIDASGMTLMPGLFDVHTHLPYSGVNGWYGDWPKNLKAYLYSGVTSVVDFGLYPEMFEPMRRLLRQGAIPGPRIHMAARITTPLGHGAEGGRGDMFSLAVSTPREARTATRRWLSYEPDAIKVFTDGWRYGASPDMTSMEEETLRAIVEEAHAKGVEVLTHTVTLARAKVAARAGVDVIAHGIGDLPADAEIAALMRASRTAYAPTMAVYEPRRLPSIPLSLAALLEPAAEALLGERLRARTLPDSETNSDNPRLARWAKLLQNTAILRGGGVSIATGTDAGVNGTWHGWSTLRELQLLVAAGLTPLEAMAAATGNSARALRVDGERGFIAAGKLADLVLIEGSPDENIAEIERVHSVWLGGREVARGELAAAFESDEPTPLPARPAPELIDDMELPEQTRIGTRRINTAETGHDVSRISFGTIAGAAGGRVLAMQAHMADRPRPFAGVVLPLSPGAVEPVDASRFAGIEFDGRGEGEYALLVQTYRVRDGVWFGALFNASPAARRVRIPFSALQRDRNRYPVVWTGTDLQALSFRISRKPGEFSWLEIDNVRFYR
jgi:imidazolonepropionase-like amidohydrolase